MYFDNLTMAGLLTVALYALLPLLFGREMLRVEEEQGGSGSPDAGRFTSYRQLPAAGDCADAKPCH